MIFVLLGALLRVALLGWLTAVGLMILIGMARGRILTDGLLTHSTGGEFHFHRLQLMIVLVIFVVGYVGHALALPPGSPLPDIKPLFLMALLGSHGAYLAGKYLEM